MFEEHERRKSVDRKIREDLEKWKRDGYRFKTKRPEERRYKFVYETERKNMN